MEDGGAEGDDAAADGDQGETAKEGGNAKANHLWPVKRVLNLRVKSLMDKITRLRKAEEKQKQRDEKSKEREDKKKTKQDQLEKEREERLSRRYFSLVVFYLV